MQKVFREVLVYWKWFRSCWERTLCLIVCFLSFCSWIAILWLERLLSDSIRSLLNACKEIHELDRIESAIVSVQSSVCLLCHSSVILLARPFHLPPSIGSPVLPSSSPLEKSPLFPLSLKSLFCHLSHAPTPYGVYRQQLEREIGSACSPYSRSPAHYMLSVCPCPTIGEPGRVDGLTECLYVSIVLFSWK